MQKKYLRTFVLITGAVFCLNAPVTAGIDDDLVGPTSAITSHHSGEFDHNKDSRGTVHSQLKKTTGGPLAKWGVDCPKCTTALRSGFAAIEKAYEKSEWAQEKQKWVDSLLSDLAEAS